MDSPQVSTLKVLMNVVIINVDKNVINIILSYSFKILEIKTFGLGSRTRDVCSQNRKSSLLQNLLATNWSA